MPILTARHWIQFRLSTWFVLIAILAWAMWLGLRAKETHHVRLVDSARSAAEQQKDIEQHRYLIGLKAEGINDWKDLGTFTSEGATYRTFEITRPGINPALLYPALALAAFVGWKAAWAMGRRVGGSVNCDKMP